MTVSLSGSTTVPSRSTPAWLSPPEMRWSTTVEADGRMADGILENDANDDDDESGMDDVMVQLKEAVCPVFTLVVVTLEIPRIQKTMGII